MVVVDEFLFHYIFPNIAVQEENAYLSEQLMATKTDLTAQLTQTEDVSLCVCLFVCVCVHMYVGVCGCECTPYLISSTCEAIFGLCALNI